jgi:predicted RecA/RadA family phage recombinase
MAKPYLQPGEVASLTAPAGGVKSGDGVVIGNLFAVATVDAAEAAEFEGALTGVWSLPKAAGAINAGARVWWDASAGNVVNASSAGLFPIGCAVQGAGTNDAIAAVRLDGIAVTAVPGA